MISKTLKSLVLAAALLGSGTAGAYTLSFYSVTNNNVADAAIGTSQLFVDVTDPAGANNVMFTFRNIGPAASSITDIYFDDLSLLASPVLTNTSGVTFSLGATPAELPGANNATPVFVASAGLSADSDKPVTPNGVNPGEVLYVSFSLLSGQEFSDVLADLQDGDLRIGIKVQGFDGGGSEAFVNNPLTPIPEPEIYAMLAAGLGLMGFVARRRTRQDAMAGLAASARPDRI